MDAAHKHTNRLAQEASPYLLQHAHNPVDWYAWGEEALARAKREDRPILLSIGYSACHWCHVMERECFEDEAIAAQMNDAFVCVKVDREERPDLDQIYQLAIQVLGRNGGWPLTMFLTPDGRPFFGGTYFPPVDKYGVPGFPRILEAVGDAYRTKRDDVEGHANELSGALGSIAREEARPRHGAAPATLGPDLLERAARKLSARFDDEHGGFGSRPKFPNTMALDVLLRRGALENDEAALKRVVHALDAMRAGGVYDQLGGGFHRYSTDERWLVPHFEKMLYDNALLLRLYVDAWRATGHARFADTAREIVTYVRREMTDPGGGFYATQDADSEGVEGKFFVWTAAEIRAALPGDDEAADAAIARWGVTDEGNFEESGSTVLHEAMPVENVTAVERARSALFAAREKRVKPFRDEKILASWSALMIGAMADAGAALGDEAMVAGARRAFGFLEASLVKDGRVMRLSMNGKAKGDGFLDDYAYVADAALDLFEATGDAAYVTRARALADAIVARFVDANEIYFAPSDGEPLIVRPKEAYDHAVPSGASIACKVLARLGSIAHAPYGELAARVLEKLAPAALENPFGFGQTIGGLDRLVRGSVDVVVVGAGGAELAREAMGAYLPNRNVVWIKDDAARAACALIAEGKTAGAAAVAYVCRGRTCSLPIGDAKELSAAIR